MQSDRNEYLFMGIMTDEQSAELLCNYIANGNFPEAEKILTNKPRLALKKVDQVPCSSGDTYLDVSAIQLTYLLDEIGMLKMLLRKLEGHDKEKDIASAQLRSKINQAEKQLANYKAYDFSIIIRAISSDEQIRSTGKAKDSTLEIYHDLLGNFAPCSISIGKSLIIKHLQNANVAGDEQNQWNSQQKQWYKTRVVGFLQSRVCKFHQFVFSQGLQNYFCQKNPLKRSEQIKDITNPRNRDNPPLINYKGDENKKLGEDYFIDIYNGAATTEESTVGIALRNKRLQEYTNLLNDNFKQCSNNQNQSNILRRLS